MREGERVMPLELFFDLVFVLALTQCTALMVETPTWEGIGQGLLVLLLLWWTWTGYAWLTSVIDPEEGACGWSWSRRWRRCGRRARGPRGLRRPGVEFALAYGAVRAAHIGLFVLAVATTPSFAGRSPALAVSTGIGVALLIAGALIGGTAQAVLWVLAIVLDIGGPFFFGPTGGGWCPAHFAERHGLIVIVALGETIVALGVGAEVGLTLP